ncbi:MAG: EI24 domain-containing protein [Planctomycetes bacterium]|nr:EI24 domain-containing protein [Planctomycetota bacterium]
MEKYRCNNCGHLAPAGAACPRCEGSTIIEFRQGPPDPGRGLIKNYFLGFNYFIEGFRFIGAHKSLVNYIIIPLIISFLIFVGLVWGALANIDHLLGFLDGDWGWLEWLRRAVYWIVWILLAILSLLTSFFVSFLLSSVINSPFYDLLSEKVEELYFGTKLDEKWTTEFFRRIFISIRESLKIALYEGLVMLGLFVVSLISAGLGTVLFALAGAYFGGLMIFEFFLARKYYTLAEKRRYLKTHLGFAMGIGTPVYIVPFLTPFAVVGATLGFLSSRRK